MAERVFAAQVAEAGLGDDVVADSAGTGAWHVGDGADPRAEATLHQHGYDGSGHQARRFGRSWFGVHDLIVAMDGGHLEDLRALAADEQERAQIVLLRAYDPTAVADDDLNVLDPYYDGESGFADRLAEIERACAGLLADLRATVLG